MVLIIRFFRIILTSIFIMYVQQHCILYKEVFCIKSNINLLSKGLLNGKLFYYYGDVKINEIGYRIQFLLDNFDKINLNTVKYLQKGVINPKPNPYNSFYHPHFLLELKNNINNFYINFQMSTKQNLNFEKLANTDLEMKVKKFQYISPYLRIYDKNLVEILENEYTRSGEFIELNTENINNYIFKNMKEYTPNFEIFKK